MTYVKRRNNIIAWGAVIVWMGIIFYLSHQPSSASSELSVGVTKFIVQTIAAIIPIEIELSTIHFFIRKGAHFFAYCTLGILLMNAFRNKYENSLFALFICIIYAISDELHQLFILGRSGEVRDVVIDTIGAAVGILLYLSLRYVKYRNK